jgi:hypothetical protein
MTEERTPVGDLIVAQALRRVQSPGTPPACTSPPPTPADDGPVLIGSPGGTW